MEEDDLSDVGLELLAAASFHKSMGTDQAVTWNDLRHETKKDETLQDLSEMIINGYPADARKWPSKLRPYYPYAASLSIVDGVVMISDRVVIPFHLRTKILSFLHPAHQGIDRMMARASDSLFWPGMTADISKTRLGCATCNKIAPSNPMTPPYTPPSPEYPFQYVCADYFHYMGKYYLVLVDRYSHWPTVYSSSNGASGLISSLRGVFSTFGIPEELASDGGPEFTVAETQEFLKNWQVHHRLSSVANPHSNCRAELAVKQVKRIISDNCSTSGSLNTDGFHKALLSYRNTPDPVTRFSPARAIFGREVRDGLPLPPGRYNPHPMWQELLDHRERGLAKRVNSKREAWSEHTRKLGKLALGDRVFIQNQTGAAPRRWERTGVVIEVNDYDQYLIKVDGTGRTTLRNRRFLRKYTPTPKLQPESQILTEQLMGPPSPHDSQLNPKPAQVNQNPTQTNPGPDHVTQDPVHFAPSRANHPEIEPANPSDHLLDDETPAGSLNNGNESLNIGRPSPSPDAPVRPPNVTPELAPTPPVQPSSPKPTQASRQRRPNPKYDPAMWDLTSVELLWVGEIKDYSISDNPSFWPLTSKQRQGGGVRLYESSGLSKSDVLVYQ